MTGRGAGFCAGNAVPGYANPVGGRGGGRGWRNQFYATGVPGWARAGYPAGFPAEPTSEQEQQSLKQEAQYLRESLDAVNKRIEELGSK
jgi:hypothetical protein